MSRLAWIALLLICSATAGRAIAAGAAAPTITKVSMGYGGLDIEFSEPMLTWLGDTAPTGLEINPPFSCSWSWTSDTQLSCRNYENDLLLPATRYRVSIRGGLWSQQGMEIAAQEHFGDSARPEISRAAVQSWSDGVPVIELETNIPVTATALRSTLSLTEDDREIRFELSPSADSKTRKDPTASDSWRIGYMPSDSAMHVLGLRVRPGLRATQGSLAGVQDATLLRARVNESFRLRLLGCGADYQHKYATPGVGVSGESDQTVAIDCPAAVGLALEFSRAPSEASTDQLRKRLPRGLRYVKLDSPPVYPTFGSDLEVIERPGHYLRLITDRPNQSFAFEIPDSMLSEDGARIVRPVRISIQSGEYLPKLILEPARLLLPVGKHPPPIISMLNTPPLELAQKEIGAGQASSRSLPLAEARTNKLTRRSPPGPQREIWKRGGFVEGSLKGPPNPKGYDSFRSNYAIAYAAFNISAGRAGDQVLVWVTDWKGAIPIADAVVELLQPDSEDNLSLLASAKTAADGTVVLDAPSGDKFKSTSDLIVRVTQGKRRSILPMDRMLERQMDNTMAFVYGIAGEGEMLDWGVSDRSLYRPGDIVRYRLWVRERHRNHLRVPTREGEITLRLRTQFGDIQTSEFNAMPDAFGSIAGELKLPETMHDDNYCISSNDEGYHLDQGACFRVSGYHLNNLWAELVVDQSLARDGDSIVLDAQTGYFSGGPAVGAKTEFQSLLMPMRLEDAYPAWQSFTFVDPYEDTGGKGGESFGEALEGSMLTDANGHARRTLLLHNPRVSEPLESGDVQPIPFGNLDLTVIASTSASNWASAPAKLLFSRYPRFVGLKVSPWLLRSDTDPEVEAIVISDTGERIDDASVAIEIEESSFAQQAEGARGKVIAQCTVQTGIPSKCPFRPQHSGIFWFRASSPGAASSTIDRYATTGESWKSPDGEAQASLTAENDHPVIGTNAELILQQPFAEARVLISVEHGQVLKHWVEHVSSPVSRISVPIERDWSPGITINAVIMDAGDVAFGPNAAADELIKLASTELRPLGAVALMPLTVSLDRSEVRPGDTVQIHLHNPRSSAMQVTLGVVDDAARALVPEFGDAANPAGDAWLGKLRSWGVPGWYGLASWPRQAGMSSNEPASIFRFVTETDTEGSLVTITVTGSRIRAADVFQVAKTSDHSLGRPVSASPAHGALRSHFAESALWRTDIVMPAGSDQTIDLTLPDNLTRWRVLAWAADAADGFTLSEATVEASLPIEVRSDAPTRVFPGDRATVRASVRVHASDARIEAQLQAKGAGVDASAQWTRSLTANTEQSISLLSSPTAVGAITVDARAHGKSGKDGVGALIEVASTTLHESLPVAGWLPAEGVQLKLPDLPSGASNPRISLEASRGLGAEARAWADGLRDYPHRCWEQTLSRAVGAAAAIRLGSAENDWPDAENVVAEAFRSAGQFQDHDGEFHFFAGVDGSDITPPSLMLTAYTVQGFAFLRALGYEIPAQIDQRAREALAGRFDSKQEESAVDTKLFQSEEFVLAAAAIGTDVALPANTLNAMWDGRDRLSWYGRANLARVMAAQPRPQAQREGQLQRLLAELRLAGRKQGMARSIAEKREPGWPFQSRILDQCGVLGALKSLDHSGDARAVRDEYLRGLADLYAGGAVTLDTQASAQCFMTLVDLMQDSSDIDAPVSFDVAVADVSARLALKPGQSTATWSHDASRLSSPLTLRASEGGDSLLSYVARLEFDIDGRQSTPSAIGFLLDRHYSVIREHAWKDIATADLREGDWVRVTLRLSTSRMRYFVAISDNVPGGLRPTDLELSGVADAGILSLASADSPWFSARQIDDRHARFYSEQLPPGTHEIYYYARATHAGRYTALPAIAELMYGNASVSRTNAARLTIGEPHSSASP